MTDLLPNDPNAFGWWLTGFADGEGHFGITRQSNRTSPFYRCVFRISLAVADRDLLRAVHERAGWGRFYEYPGRKGQQDVVIWTTTTKAVGDVVAHFDAFPLASRKRLEYRVWRLAALAQVQRSHGPRDAALSMQMENAYSLLRAMRDGVFAGRAAA